MLPLQLAYHLTACIIGGLGDLFTIIDFKWILAFDITSCVGNFYLSRIVIQHMEGSKSLMIDEESQPETVNKEMIGKFPIKLLNQPLHSRSISHIKQVMCLLKFIMNYVEFNSQSQYQLTDSDLKAYSQDFTTNAQLETPELEMTPQVLTSVLEKKVDPRILLFSIPKTKIILLSSLLACEGLSDLAYYHATNVLMKSMKVALPHRHIFMTVLSNAIERLSKVVVGDI